MIAKDKVKSQQVIQSIRAIVVQFDMHFVDERVPEALNPLKLQYKSLADQQIMRDSAEAILKQSQELKIIAKRIFSFLKQIYAIAEIEVTDSTFEFDSLGGFVKLLNSLGYKQFQYKQMFDNYAPLQAELETIAEALQLRVEMFRQMRQFNELQGANTERKFDIQAIATQDQLTYEKNLCRKTAKFMFNRAMKRHIIDETNIKLNHYIQLFSELLDFCQRIGINSDQPDDFIADYEEYFTTQLLSEINKVVGFDCFQDMNQVLKDFKFQTFQDPEVNYQNHYLTELYQLISNNRQVRDQFFQEMLKFRKDVTDEVNIFRKIFKIEPKAAFEYENAKQIFVELKNDKFYQINVKDQKTLQLKMDFVKKNLKLKNKLLQSIQQFNENEFCKECGKSMNLRKFAEDPEFTYVDEIGGRKFDFYFNRQMNEAQINKFQQDLNEYEKLISYTNKMARDLGIPVEYLNQSYDTFYKAITGNMMKQVNKFGSVDPKYTSIELMLQDFQFLFRHVNYNFVQVENQDYQKLANTYVDINKKLEIIDNYLKDQAERVVKTDQLYQSNSYVLQVLAKFEVEPFFGSKLFAFIDHDLQIEYFNRWQFYERALFVDIKKLLTKYEYYFLVLNHYLTGNFYQQFEPKFGLLQLYEDFNFLAQSSLESLTKKFRQDLPKFVNGYLTRMHELVCRSIIEFENNRVIAKFYEIFNMENTVSLQVVGPDAFNEHLQLVFKFMKYCSSNPQLHSRIPLFVRPWQELQILLEEAVNMYSFIQCFLKMEETDDPVFLAIINSKDVKSRIAIVFTSFPQLREQFKDIEYTSDFCQYIVMFYVHWKQDQYINKQDGQLSKSGGSVGLERFQYEVKSV